MCYFVSTLRWPAGGLDLGVGGVSGQGVQFQCRLFCLVQALIFGVLVAFIGAMMRCLCLLPGLLGRFVPCSIGTNHCRLRHVGWEESGHGLTSRPRESASEVFLDELLLLLFQYPPKSSRALLAGTLPLRYCSTRFASRVPTWRLPVLGHVAGLVHAGGGGADGSGVEVGAE